MLAIEKLISLILKVTAFLIIIIIIFLLAKTIYEELSGHFKKEEILEKYSYNIEDFFKNIEECEKIDDYDCFCEAFPNFPASFHDYLNLKFERKDSVTNITLNYKKSVENWSEIKSTFGIYNVKRWELDIKNLEEFKKYNNMTIEFNKYQGYPLISTKEILNKNEIKFEYILVSPYLLKKREENQDYLLLIGINKDDEIKAFERINELEYKVKCINGRNKSIEFLKKIIENLTRNNEEKNIKINISDGFSIIIEGENLSLYYENNIVEEIDKTAIEIYKKWIDRGMNINYYFIKFGSKPIKFKFNRNILCSNIDKKILLTNKNIIEIKKVNDQSCIEKIK